MILIFQHVKRVFTVDIVEGYAAKTVSTAVDVTGSQVIVTKDVNKDGQEANVINVKVWFLYLFAQISVRLLKNNAMKHV